MRRRRNLRLETKRSATCRRCCPRSPWYHAVTSTIGNPISSPRVVNCWILAGQWKLTKKYHWQMTRGNFIGIIIGVLPGAGADMAAWVSYAMSKRFSKEPEKFGTGHVEGLVEAGASNNASIASGWVRRACMRSISCSSSPTSS